ncbi:MAG: hypothetical protein Ta2G_16100 [Termitinemataceae bacterium]|nr:MAG: hypothetical protein Ta2G_16100 [Termitinemataceae bacterium]
MQSDENKVDSAAANTFKGDTTETSIVKEISMAIAQITCTNESDFLGLQFSLGTWYESHSNIKKIIIDASALPSLSTACKTHLNDMRNTATKYSVELELKL